MIERDNGYILFDSALPFGGYKQSGWGREMGHEVLEFCHWFALGCAPVFFLWHPWWGDLIIAGYTVAANLPCILVQRYNRARLRRLLAAHYHQVSENVRAT